MASGSFLKKPFLDNLALISRKTERSISITKDFSSSGSQFCLC